MNPFNAYVGQVKFFLNNSFSCTTALVTKVVFMFVYVVFIQTHTVQVKPLFTPSVALHPVNLMTYNTFIGQTFMGFILESSHLGNYHYNL